MVSDNNVKNYIVDSKNVENMDTANIIDPEKERRRQNSLNNLRPWRKLDDLTPEEQERQREIARKGGHARNNQIIKQKTMKESAQALLSAKVSTEYAQKVLGENYDITGIETMQDLITARMIRETLENGNTKAAEFIRDTSGNKPVSAAALDITADIVTAADRALIEKVADRLGMVDITDDNDDENA